MALLCFHARLTKLGFILGDGFRVVYSLQVAKGSRIPTLVGFASGLTPRLLSESPVVRIALLGHLAA